MKLPNAGDALIERAKVHDYLLAPEHPEGRGKAKFFVAFGFPPEDWRLLADAIREMISSTPITRKLEVATARSM